jgi:hypothetical protein
MKTKILLLLPFALLALANVSGQSITNGSFEYWTQQILYEDPVPYFTTNINAYMANGSNTITKSAIHHGGNYSAKLETLSTGADTTSGVMFIGTPGNQAINGGTPIAIHPDSLKMWARFSIMTNDTASIIVILKNSGATIGYGAFQFIGNQATFIQFKTKITWLSLLTSDTMAVIITASRLDGAKIPGSTLYVDDISFTGSLIAFPNGGFETWNTLSTVSPDNWFSFNFACLPGDTSATKTTDHYDGTYAMKLKSVPLTIGDTMGFLTNGTFGSNGPAGGLPISQNPSFITGYYKYIPVGLDTAIAVGMDFYHNTITDSVNTLDASFIKLPPASSYTYFEIPFSYNGTPVTDTVNVTFASGNAQGAFAGLGSTLFLDQLGILYMPVGVSENDQQTTNVTVFPNPSNGNCGLSINLKDDQSLSIELYDSKGQKVYSEKLDNANNTVNKLNLSALAKGIYYMNVKTKDKAYSRKIILQ